MFRRLHPFVFILALLSAETHGADTEVGPPIVGLDHMPLAVPDLAASARSYEQLGFALKEGRLHANGLRNSHVKFPDGSGVELISPPAQAGDALASRYRALLHAGEGPAYFSLHARTTDDLVARLKISGTDFELVGDIVTLTDPALDFLFFVRDNRSPTDLPQHFAHSNTATAMTGVWLALDDQARAKLERLLTALGAALVRERVFAPQPVDASVAIVQNGRLVMIPEHHQLIPGRPIVGAEFKVADIEKVPDVHTAFKHPGSVLLAPDAGHGLWLEFHQAR